MAKNNDLGRMKQSEQAKKITLAEWRAQRVHEVALPSGLVVTVRDVTLTDLMLTGKLPPAIMDIMTETAKQPTQEFDTGLITRNTEEWNAMLNGLVELSLVKPRVGAVADDEHILLAEIPADDKLAIFNFVNRGADELRSFREGEAEPVAVV